MAGQDCCHEAENYNHQQAGGISALSATLDVPTLPTDSLQLDDHVPTQPMDILHLDDPNPTIDSDTTIEEGTGQGQKSIEFPGLPIGLPNMPIAGNNASDKTSDNTLTVNEASASTPSSTPSTLVAGGGGLKERIEKLKVRFLY